MKNCTVVYAIAERQWLWQVALDDAADVGAALAAARQQAGTLEVPWDGDVGIFGELCARNAPLRDGDRVEIYRPLRSDPKESRRERARARKAAPDRELSAPRKELPRR